METSCLCSDKKRGLACFLARGTDVAYDWKGKVPYEDMPFLYNPPSGYISTANNKTIGEDFPYYISGLWNRSSRTKQNKKGFRVT